MSNFIFYQMSEQIVQIENINPSDLYGANDQHLTKIKNLFPKLKLIARGDFVKVIGEDDEVNFFLDRLSALVEHIERFGSIGPNVIEDIMVSSAHTEYYNSPNDSDVIVFGKNGLQIKAITVNQKKMVDSISKKDMVFAVGPAGTGKTYTAVALAEKQRGSWDYSYSSRCRGWREPRIPSGRPKRKT